MPEPIIRVAVPSPLNRLFDYLPPVGISAKLVPPGTRVWVPFGRTRQLGMVVERADTSDWPRSKIRRILEILDSEPLIPADLMALGRWAAAYYHHPPGEVFTALLPTLFRRGAAAKTEAVRIWSITPAGRDGLQSAALGRAPRQRALLQSLNVASPGLSDAQLNNLLARWREAARTLVVRGWIQSDAHPSVLASPVAPLRSGPELTDEQQRAVTAIESAAGGFQALLLEGVTGSGKTEVYLQAILATLARGQQVLVLVPEIGLTPQLLGRFRARLPAHLGVLHSALGDRERANTWLDARDGRVPVIVGTRSSVFTPFHDLGLIVVDEEHDASFKQQDGFRYSARDLAVWRAQQQNIPVVLGSATPSLEALDNAQRGRYAHQRLMQRATGAPAPSIQLVDVRGCRMQAGLAPVSVMRVRQHLERGEQVLVFLNRRGFAPVLLCHACGWSATCPRCDAHMTIHRQRQRQICHHCGHERALPDMCPDCEAGDLIPVGQGTERIATDLSTLFPDHPLVRIDRDSTRQRGSLEQALEAATSGKAKLLVGTQMLAKGHHFPGVTLVVILDVDQGLFSADFRASERMAQLVLQVAGRAGRAELPGTVMLQTHHPEHPLLLRLIETGYPGFSEAALGERREAGFPPFAAQALLRAEATDRAAPDAFLAAAVALAGRNPDLDLWGPVPAPMERRAGRWRAQLLIRTRERAILHRFLDRWAPGLETLKEARRVRWSLDVDPMEMY